MVLNKWKPKYRNASDGKTKWQQMSMNRTTKRWYPKDHIYRNCLPDACASTSVKLPPGSGSPRPVCKSDISWMDPCCVCLAPRLFPLPSALLWDKDLREQLAILPKGNSLFVSSKGNPLLNAFQKLQAQSLGLSHSFHSWFHILFPHQDNGQTKADPGRCEPKKAVGCPSHS